MLNNYASFSKKTRSVKYVLCTIEALQQKKLFNQNGLIYDSNSPYFVSGVIVDGIELESSESLGEGSFFYDVSLGVLFFRLLNDESPNGKRIFFKLRFFFSNIPLNFSSFLSNDEAVEWQPRINQAPELKLELDFENSGTVLETNSQLALENADGFFDSIFDVLIWEGQKINAYSWGDGLPESEMKLFYRGKIDSKAFNTQQITFNIRDQVNDLREKVNYTTFQNGRFSDLVANKPKRIVFGQADRLQTIGIDKVLNGYPLTGVYSGSANRNLMTGTLSGVASSSTINGAGTLFLSQISAGDDILFIDGVFEYTYKVLSVSSNTVLTLTNPITVSFSNATARNKSILNNKIFGTGTEFKKIFSPNDQIRVFVNEIEFTYSIEEVVDDFELTLSDEIQISFDQMEHLPQIPSRYYNRDWHVAGHKLRSKSFEVLSVLSAINFELDSISELSEGDTLAINGNFRRVLRITGNEIVINQSISGVIVGNFFEKIPVPAVYNRNKLFIFGRDYSVTNTQDDCVINLFENAEFNTSFNRSFSVSFNFVNGSDTITAISTDRDLTQIFKPRDWIISKDINHQIWYEILSVDVLSIRLRTNYQGSNYTGQLSYRSPEYVSDNSLILCDCIGIESESKWIRTPSEIVKYLLNDIGMTDLNDQSFEEAAFDCDYTTSIFFPESIGAEMPSVRDAITLINKSIFGSLFIDQNFQFSYNILNSNKDESLFSVKDDDIIGFSVQTRNQILGKVRVNFAPFTDFQSGSLVFREIDEESDFVKETSGVRKEEVFTSYLYNENDAQIIAERWAFFRSLTQSVVNVQSKLNFMTYGLNQQMFLDLERLFVRYGGNGRKKIGIINGITKSGTGSLVSFNDVGNIFNRVGAIAPDDQEDYEFSNPDDVAKFCFIVDNITETPNEMSEVDLGNNLIG